MNRRKITCTEREEAFPTAYMVPTAGGTEPYSGRRTTRWAFRTSPDVDAIEDVMHLREDGTADTSRPCEHYALTEDR